MAQQLLIENAPFTLKLEESKDGAGATKYTVRGQFARSDKATENKRLYREHLWKREIGRLVESMKGRRAFGELDHPADGRTKLQRVSHLMTDLRVEGNEVVGEAEVLDTPNGRILKALFQAGAQVGVSSRGYGSTKTLSDGTEEVQEDFRLDTFDFVADPATRTAYPKVFAEEREHVVQAEKDMTVESLRRDYPGLLKVIAEDSIGSVANAITEAENRAAARLKGTFSTQLRKMVETVTEDAYRKARSELESDPEVAAAKGILENIVSLVSPFGMDEKNREAVDAKDAEIADLRKRLADRELEVQKHQRESSEFQKLAKESGYRLHVERKLGDHPSKETIVKLLGDVTVYASLDKVDERLADIAKEFDHKKPRATEDSDRIADLQKQIEDLQAKLSESTDKEKRALALRDESVEKARLATTLAESFQTKLHVERQLANHPDADRIRGLCEGVSDKDSADRIIASASSAIPRLPEVGSDEVRRIRERVGRGVQNDLVEDTHGSKSNGSQGNGSGGILGQFGLMDEEFDRLAGSRPTR